ENGYSGVADVAAAGTSSPQELLIDKLVEERFFPENRWFKPVWIRSRLLSEFHQRDVFMRGAVLLPASYYDRFDRRYPVLFDVPGFSDTHLTRVSHEPIPENNAGDVEFLRVTLDPSCPLGHHVFADSANNGPVGQALITEFIPELDRQFRTVAKPTARFLTGHSSGGWSSLWLQVTYPENFGGTWSTSPDPVDFRDFQQINLYRTGENMYRDSAGNRRPIARIDGSVRLWYDDFDHMEDVLGFGGQLHSFEAVFSPRGADGKPMRAWSRTTGAVDTEVTRTWEKYDIRLILERRWPELGPKLAGKLHVFMGDADTFYLEGACGLLKESLARLGSDAVVEIVPGKTHFDLLDDELRMRMRREIVQSYLKNHSKE
ncbi:MAG TPA: alpha/beta hydrolase-fold protein, partial [Planctomycetaceae bacterium]|nr:alpha/beta hydrolase-fold protein [Planctomycetaceae bacterium]